MFGAFPSILSIIKEILETPDAKGIKLRCQKNQTFELVNLMLSLPKTQQTAATSKKARNIRETTAAYWSIS